MARHPQSSAQRNRAGGLLTIIAAGVLGVGVVTVVEEIREPEAPLEMTAKVSEMGASAGGAGLLVDGFEGAGGEGPPLPTPPACPLPPPGMTEVRKDWAHAWAYGNPCSPRALCERQLNPYPSGQSYPAPLGAAKGTYVVVPFTPNAGQSVNLYFDQVQSRPSIGYSQRPARGMFLSITRCPGDLRAPDAASEDPWLRPSCRMFENGGALIWTTGANPAACKVEPGVEVYLQIAPYDPATGGESCASAPASLFGCDVGAVTSTGPG